MDGAEWALTPIDRKPEGLKYRVDRLGLNTDFSALSRSIKGLLL